jgi:hypothetical protein
MHPTTINDYDYENKKKTTTEKELEANTTLEDPTSKTQKVIAQVKRAVPGLMARDYGFFSTQTSLV